MKLIWEKLECASKESGFLGGAMAPLWRSKVPGGWFVMAPGASSFFYPASTRTRSIFGTVLRCRRGTMGGRGQRLWRLSQSQ